MKTKTWLKLSGWLSLPMFLTYIVSIIIAILGLSGKDIDLNTINHPVLAVFGIIGVISLAIIITTTLYMQRHANKMDDLDNEIQKYNSAKQEYNDQLMALAKQTVDKTINREKHLANDLTAYIKDKHNQDECSGFSDGFNAGYKFRG